MIFTLVWYYHCFSTCFEKVFNLYHEKHLAALEEALSKNSAWVHAVLRHRSAWVNAVLRYRSAWVHAALRYRSAWVHVALRYRSAWVNAALWYRSTWVSAALRYRSAWEKVRCFTTKMLECSDGNNCGLRDQSFWRWGHRDTHLFVRMKYSNAVFHAKYSKKFRSLLRCSHKPSLWKF